MAYDPASLDAPFAALRSYDWGGDAKAFQPLDDAVVAAHADAGLRTALETRLAALLGEGTSRAAKEYICRKLSLLGTAASVPALAALLPQQDHSHMARFALERIGAPEAAAALRKAAESVEGDLKIGMVSSLAGKGDTAAVPLLAAMLQTGMPQADRRLASAAAEALGRLATPEAAQALAAAAGASDPGIAAAIVDARLACAEALLQQGKRAEALALYKAVETTTAGGTSPAAKSAAVAVTRGILACLDTSSPA
jgi:HEAT repeat protein